MRIFGMSSDPQPRLPAGRPPWDPINGLRVGAFAGGAIGLIVTVLAGTSNVALILIGMAVGGIAGYWSEKRKQRQPD